MTTWTKAQAVKAERTLKQQRNGRISFRTKNGKVVDIVVAAKLATGAFYILVRDLPRLLNMANLKGWTQIGKAEARIMLQQKILHPNGNNE